MIDPEEKVLLKKEYEGFESYLDIGDDILTVIPDGEYEGIITVTVTYKEQET